MATIALGFNISASATGMAQGVNAAAVELEKLGYAAKKTAADVGVLKTLSIGRAFIDSIQAIAGSFSSLTSGTLQAVDSTANLARELGVSYGELEQLQIAAQLAGASTESLAKAFTKAQVLITKAANGGKEASAALAAIGLSAADFEGLTSSQQFALLANAINQISDPAQRAAAAVAIFGRSGAELLPVFRELGENLATSQALLAQFGGGINDAQAGRIQALGDSFDLVRKAIEIVASKVLAELQPALTAATQEFISFLASLDIAAVAQTATSVLEAVGGALSFAYSTASLVSPVFKALADGIAFIADNGRGAAVGLGLAVGGLAAYQVAANIAAIATLGFAGAIKALLASTGIGLLVVVLGTAGGALLEWATRAEQAGGQGSSAVQNIGDASTAAIQEAQRVAQGTSAAIKEAYSTTEDEAKKAAAAAKKAADDARRQADSAIQRLVTEQQFGGDSQRAAAAEAVQAIEQDILRTQQEIDAAREKGDQAAIDAGVRRLAQLDQAMSRERDIASGARKAAEERLKLEKDYAKAREQFDQRRLAALARPSTELLQLEDTRTASGYAALQRFSQDQQGDPALEEYRKQLRELTLIRQRISGLAPSDTVDIIGA